MMNQGAIVTYREFSRKVAGYCGIVEGVVQDKPNHVLVRWVGNTSESEESVADLEEVLLLPRDKASTDRRKPTRFCQTGLK